MTKFVQIGSFEPEVLRVGALPTFDGEMAMEASFRALSVETLLKTHRDTHALALSQRLKIDSRGSKWTGQFKFGGGTVDYAIYEFNGVYGRRVGVGKKGMYKRTVPMRKDKNYRAKRGDHNPMPNGKPEEAFIAILLKELAG